MNKRSFFVVLGLVALVRAVFIGVPRVIVLVVLVIVAFVVLALSVFVFPVVLWAASGHYCRCGKEGSQKNRTEISVSTMHAFSF